MEKTILNEDKARLVLGYSIILTYLTSALLGFWLPVPEMVSGTLDQLVMLVVGFYFGSSMGSKSKELILKKI